MSDVDLTPGNEPARSFDTGQVNKIVQERLSREREKAAARELELVETHKTERAELETQLVETNSRLTEIASRVQQAQIGEAVARAAHERNIRDVDAAARLLDPSLVQVAEDGRVDVSIAVDALLESKPYLREPRTGGTADQGARGSYATALTAADIELMSPDEYESAKRAGRLKHMGVG
jgi:hypothetical protein